MTERERSDFLGGDKNNDHFYKRSHTNSSAGSVPAKKIKFENASSSGSFPQLNYKTAGSKTSLLSMWCGRMDAIAASRHEEFEGRSSSSGNQAELYVDMNGDNNSNSSRSTLVGTEWN